MKKIFSVLGILLIANPSFASDITWADKADGGTFTAANANEVKTAVNSKQDADADLTDLADGSLTGSKVGTGINGDNVTTGTVADARIASTIARDTEIPAVNTLATATLSCSSTQIAKYNGSAWVCASDENSAGTGDVVSVGDCTSGACLDGTSDGGTIIYLYGPNGFWQALQAGASTANRSWRLPIDAVPSAGTTRLMNMDEYGQMGFVDPATYLTPTGVGGALTVTATGFDGNLATTDNTLQEIAQKLDDLSVSGGYTNLTSFVAQTPWRMFYSNTAGDVTELALGADGEYLKSNGASAAPSWATPSGAAHDAVTLDTETSAIFSLSTQQITLDSQTANTFLAAPNGSAGDPTFRAIADTDIPSAIARDSEIPAAVTDATISTSAVSTNDASTSKHGWLMMATAPASGLRNIVAIDNAETSYKNAALFDATSPSTQAMGDSATVGTAMTASRRDHKHAMPSYSTLATGLSSQNWTLTGAVDMSGASSVLMGPISFEGATADDYETTFSITDPTADRTITVLNLNSTIPAAASVDASGKILSAGLADTPSANGISLFTAANYAAMRTLLDLEAGTDFNVAASTTAAGIVELAIDSEVNTGTATDRAVTPDSLAGSNLGTKEVCWMVKKSDTVTGAAADGIEAFVVPASMNGMNLVDVTCAVADLNSAASGATTVVLRRVRGATAVDMTSTGVTVGYDEYTASDETVDTSNDDIATGDKIYVDVNAVTTANHKGLGCTAMFRLP